MRANPFVGAEFENRVTGVMPGKDHCPPPCWSATRGHARRNLIWLTILFVYNTKVQAR